MIFKQLISIGESFERLDGIFSVVDPLASAFNPLDDPFGVFGLILWVYKDLALPRSPHENATTYSSPATFRILVQLAEPPMALQLESISWKVNRNLVADSYRMRR